MRIGLTELILIAVVILAFVRPEKLKEYSKTLGEALREVKDKKEQAQAEIIEPLKDDISAVKEPIDEVMQPIRETADLVNGLKL